MLVEQLGHPIHGILKFNKLILFYFRIFLKNIQCKSNVDPIYT